MYLKHFLLGMIVLGLVGCGSRARDAASAPRRPQPSEPAEVMPDSPDAMPASVADSAEPSSTPDAAPVESPEVAFSRVPDLPEPNDTSAESSPAERMLSPPPPPQPLTAAAPPPTGRRTRSIPESTGPAAPLTTKSLPPEAAPPDEGFTRVSILYATDRKRDADTPNEYFGAERRDGPGPFECGQCEVTIPARHDPGEIERPTWWKFEFSENPQRHVMLRSVQPLAKSGFLAALRTDVDRSRSKSALVFVHGFNVAFADAARRTAQMKHDLHFDGAALLYTWPAPKNYIECEGNATWTRPHLIEFLTAYVHKSGAQRIHLVAHSMGTRVLTDALNELVQMRGSQAPRYNQIVLAAPDIDAAVFRQQIAPRIVNSADRISIYASSKDLALVASKAVHHYVRLGEGGENLSVFPDYPQIEVVDATAIEESLLGHSYYGDSPTILRDMRLVLAGVSAIRRGLEAHASHFLLIRR
jgi:esterase/lipase superfamily enzyme